MKSTPIAFYGSRRITAQLQHEGYAVNRKRIQTYMREMGIWGLAPGPHTSSPHPRHPIYPYLLRGVTAAYPNHIWGIDITYSTLAAWLALSRGDYRLVFALRGGLGTVGNVGTAVCADGGSTSPCHGRARHLESRPGQPFYQSSVYGVALSR